MKIRELIAEGASTLRSIIGDRSLMESRLLLSRASDLKLTEILTKDELTLTSEQTKLFRSLLNRRLNHEPIAYLLGEKEFLGLPFKVSPAVLIPRPETESLVLETEKWIRARPAEMATSKTRVIDLGTGSGCIILSLAHRFKDKLEVFAMEWSDEAMQLAIENAKALQVKCHFQKDDLLAPTFNQTFDVILSNPPYIPTMDLNDLTLDIKNFEPSMALDGGEYGMRFYEGIVRQWWPKLHSGGLLGLETYDDAQRERILKLLKPLHTKSIWVIDCHLFIEKA